MVDLTTQGTEFPRINYWEDLYRRVEDPSHVENRVIFQGNESPQLVEEMAETEVPRSPYSLYPYITWLSDADVVIAHAETGTNYWQNFQGHIEDLSHVENRVIFQGNESPQLVEEMAETEVPRSPYPLYPYMTWLSDADVVIAHAETGTNYWQNFQGHIEDPSPAEAKAIFQEPKSPQLFGGMVEIKDVLSAFLLSTSVPPPSDADVVLTHAETGSAKTDFAQFQKLFQLWTQQREISGQFDVIEEREDNWDGRGSQKPTDLTLAHAKKVTGGLLDSVTSAGYQCDTPSISNDGDGNVTAVWYKDERQLHFQIGEHEAEYFRVWGTNIDTEMDVDFLKPEHYLPLWKWLIGERQLHFQIGEHEAEYFRVWDTYINTEMGVDF